MDSGFREVDLRERGLLEKLLELEFPGREELRAQLDYLTAKQAAEDGTLLLRCSSGRPAVTQFRVAAEALCKDEDGGQLSVLLHVDQQGFLHMLEIIKYDGSTIVRPPSAHDLVVLPPETREDKQ
jgi:Domain of unknown function (DUF6984)